MADWRETAGMRSRALVVALGLLFIAAWWAPIEAQQPPRVPKVGYLTLGTETGVAVYTAALRQGMRDLGHVEGKTANALGLTLSRSLLQRADQLIQ